MAANMAGSNVRCSNTMPARDRFFVIFVFSRDE